MVMGDGFGHGRGWRTAANSYVRAFHVDSRWLVYKFNAWDLVRLLSMTIGPDGSG